jgi:hypothetical protein
MTFRTSGAINGFGNILDAIRYDIRSKQGGSPESKNGLKIGIVLYVFKKGEKIPHMSNWTAGESGDDFVRMICLVEGVTESIPSFVETDFQKSLQNQMTSAEALSSSLGRFPVFVGRNKDLPVPLPGDSVLVSFLEQRGVSYGVYEDYYLKSVMSISESEQNGFAVASSELGAGGGGSTTRVLQRTPELEQMAKSGGSSGYFARFKLSYNKDVFRGNLTKVMEELRQFSNSERKALSFQIAAWDAVMGGDTHTIDETTSKRTGFDCIGQNAKVLALAHFLYKGTPYQHPLGGKEKPLQLVKDGKFVYNNYIHYLSFEGSNDLIYKPTTIQLRELPLGSAGISKNYKNRNGYIATFGHIYTLVDHIGDFTIWCEGRTGKTTRLTVMGGNGQVSDLNLATTIWSGIDEGGVGRVTDEYSRKFWKNKEELPLAYIPHAYIGVLKEPW